MLQNDTATQISVDGLLMQALAEILRQREQTQTVIPRWVSKVKEILHDSPEEKITLQLLSSETGIHPVHLSKQFAKYFHMGFGQYIRRLRLEKAVQLLCHSNLSLSQIAFECGFADQSHFVRCLRQTHGTTPHAYRKKINEG